MMRGVEISSTIKEVDRDRASDVATSDALADAILGEETASTIEAMPVIRTVPRQSLILAQTPQVFRYKILQEAYQHDLDGITDDASLIERQGHSVSTFTGSSENIKVTTKADLLLAEVILKNRIEPENLPQK